MNIFLGFDPGGDDSFGWAVCLHEENTLRVMATGRVGYAKEAVAQALTASSARGTIVAAGIDAPLFWTEEGGRDVDVLVRRAIQRLGAATPGGTVQHFNSLRGACLVQGVLTAKLLHEQHPQTTFSESHPKALLYLMGIANAETNPTQVTLRDLSNYVTCDALVGEHERDKVGITQRRWVENRWERDYWSKPSRRPGPPGGCPGTRRSAGRCSRGPGGFRVRPAGPAAGKGSTDRGGPCRGRSGCPRWSERP